MGFIKRVGDVMPLPKHKLIERNVVEGYIGDEQFQPAGVDLTVAKVFRFTSNGRIDYDNSERKLSDVEEIVFDENGYVHLPKGTYKVQYREIVSIPKDVVAWILPRSSLLRCGVSIESAVWDPGYRGRGEGLLIVYNEHGFMLKNNGKIGQMVFLPLVEEARETYSGKYQGENI